MKRRPLVIRRRSLRKDGKPNLPWVFRCGCGLRSQCAEYEWARTHLLFHRCEDFHP